MRVENKENVMKKSSKSFIFWLLLLVPIIAISMVLILDIGGFRTTAVDLVKGRKQVEQLQIDAVKEQEKIQREWDKLKLREVELQNMESDLLLKKDDMAIVEEETLKLNTEAEALQAKLTAEVEDLMDVVALYEKMETENAARILELLEEQAMTVLILKNMKTDSAAAIIEQMQPDKAAAIVHAMLYK
ncbi:MAG: hypothetical protein IMZ47_03845 [Firmicutes bacterium]|nr:hypothetical protein [Bacillota bacterium]